LLPGFIASIVLISIVAVSERTNSVKVDSRSSPVASVSRLPVQLKDETLARGIDYLHLQTSGGITGLDEALGSGACAFDMDNDHDMDLFLVGGSGHQRFYGKESWWSKKHTGRLYRNRGDGNFDDITEQAGLAISTWGMGCNAADFDLDGFVDLFITARNGNYVFKNRGGTEFIPMAWEDNSGWSTSAAIGDYNGDGKMDIYVANYLDYDNTAKQFEAFSGFKTTHAEFKAENFQSLANQLYSNRGGFEFESLATKLGVDNTDGRSLAAKWFDFNDDGWLDLLVINDSGSSTRLYLNRDGKSFDKAPLEQQLELPSGIRDGSIQDFNGDGKADLVLSTRLGEPPVLLSNRGDSFSNTLWQRHSDANRLTGFSGYGVQLADLNNDGELDIFHGNGLSEPDPDAAAISSGQPDFISLGDGRGNFVPAIHDSESTWGLPLSTRSVISVDVDNDGDRDLLLTANNNPARLLINRAPVSNWTGFELIDRYGNRDNFDKLILTTDQRQKTFTSVADTFLGRQDGRVSLVLNGGESLEGVDVFWRDGSRTHISAPAVNSYHVVRQDSEERIQYAGTRTSASTLPAAKLAIWQIKSGQFDRRTVFDSFLAAPGTDKLEFIATILQQDDPHQHLAILEAALEDDDPDVVLAAIGAFQDLELETSYYWLANLFNHENPEILCALASTFRHFYIEEEAFIHRKSLAVTHLIKLLDHADANVARCATMALAESKNYRAVVPIERLLLSSDDSDLLQAAMYALGELRHSRSVAALITIANNDPKLREARNRALRQLDAYDLADSIVSYKAPDPSITKSADECPVETVQEILELEPRLQAQKLNVCSPLQQQQWLEKNRQLIDRHAENFLGNRWLNAETFDTMARHFGQSPGFKITRLILDQLNQRTELAEGKALIEALRNRLRQENLEKLLMRMMKNRRIPKAMRIAAGDVLIDYDPRYVMEIANELFDETTPDAAQ